MSNVVLSYYYHPLHFYVSLRYTSGDIIKEVDGKVVAGVRDVLDVMGLEVGRSIEFKILRDANEFSVHLITAPETMKSMPMY